MTEAIEQFFNSTFGSHPILATILIAMIPIIELRGAIPFACGYLNMGLWQSFAWSLLGSCLVVPIIALIFMPIIKWLKNTKLFSKIATAIENKVKRHAQSIDNAEEKNKRFSPSYWKKALAVFIFVAIPLPLTGVWTGTCVSVFVNLDFWTTCITVILGNIVAGLIITLILLFFPWLQSWLFLIFLGIVALVLIIGAIKSAIQKKRTKDGSNV